MPAPVDGTNERIAVAEDVIGEADTWGDVNGGRFWMCSLKTRMPGKASTPLANGPMEPDETVSPMTGSMPTRCPVAFR
jgi:hypothetical protein